jgi:lipase ATG15
MELKHMVVPPTSHALTTSTSSSSVHQYDYRGVTPYRLEKIRHVAGPMVHTVRSTLSTQQSAPDMTDKNTLLMLANMTSDAYIKAISTEDWQETTGYTPTSFDWNNSTLRGYIFTSVEKTDDSPSLVIISIKGTTPEVLLDPRARSIAEHDKLMDNLFFSCCCANVDLTWTPVCGCASGHHQCQSSCLTSTLQDSNSYYEQLQLIYYHVALKLYPNTKFFWFIGHSMGGALASLMSLTTGHPAVAFESPGEKLAALRLNLSIDESMLGHYPIYHVGNTGDPIFMGTCQGLTSACYYAGYAIETACHVGSVYIYNASISTIINHSINIAIEEFIKPYPIPEPQVQTGCNDCTRWTFI